MDRKDVMPEFSTDWTSAHIAEWKTVLCKFIGKPGIVAIEIGCWEGRSTLWFLTEVLTHETSRIICIDPWIEPKFYQNLQQHFPRVELVKEYSRLALRTIPPQTASFVYIDGNHAAANVLEDAILSFPALSVGGVMIFDDYLWDYGEHGDPLKEPKIAIDAFLQVYAKQIKLLHKDWQVIVEKTAEL